MRRAHRVSLSQVANHPNDHAFNLKRVGWLDTNRLHRFVGRMEFYRSAFPLVSLDRGFPIHCAVGKLFNGLVSIDRFGVPNGI